MPGSLSSPLTTRYRGQTPGGQKPHFTPAGKPAPPRPSRLAVLTSSTTSSGALGQRGLAGPRSRRCARSASQGVRVVVVEARRDDLRSVGDGHVRPLPRRAGRAVIQTGSSAPSSGRAAPAARSAGMCWRMRARVPWGGISSSRRPARRSSTSWSNVVVARCGEVAVVDLEAGRLGAGGDALDVLEGEQAVGGGAAGLDAEGLLGVLQQLLAAQELAGDVGADVDHVAARPARA